MDNDHGITDELRSFTKDHLLCYASQEQHVEQLTAIADRIDAAHEEAIASVMNDALYHANDKDMAELGWVRLPKDADGEYIHIGDVMEWCDNGDTLEVVGIGADDTLFYFDKDSDGDEMADWTSARNKRHHHKQTTVEDVLWDMHMKLDDVAALHADEPTDSDELERDVERIFAEYAAKLQLRGDAE